MNVHIIVGPNGQCRCGENGKTCAEIIAAESVPSETPEERAKKFAEPNCSPIEPLPDERKATLAEAGRLATLLENSMAQMGFHKWELNGVADRAQLADAQAQIAKLEKDAELTRQWIDARRSAALTDPAPK